MNENLIDVRDLTLAYEGRPVAEHVKFILPGGGCLCVVGGNGTGKSTLMKAIIGAVKPAGGTMTIAERIRRTGIGYLPQQSEIQRDFPASVNEVVLSGCVRRDRFGLIWKKESKERAAEAMALLGVADLGAKSFGELSGGQRQRVLLARAFCASSELLLLDEPVTGLDPDAAHGMYEAIRLINGRGCAILMVTHDVTCALHEADHVLSMCRGHSFYGTVDEYLAHEAKDEAEDEKLHHHGHGHHEHDGGCGCHEHDHGHHDGEANV